MTDIEKALAEHFRVWSMTGPGTGEPKCGTDSEPWPCSFWQAIKREAAHAKALAEALREMQSWGVRHKCWCPFDTYHVHEPACIAAGKALAAYDKDHER